uniref:Uncharacterized protein n=2 Tax=Alexandrium monilatum TaxID=311494 RepID=A0A7S4SSM6_9DINO
MGAVLPLDGVGIESVLEGVGPDRREQLIAHLDALAGQRVKFSHVAVWREAFLGGAADHHTLVYEYSAGRRLMSLKIDWGREGLSFTDSEDDPCPSGDIIRRKLIRLRPEEVKKHLLEVKDWDYVLTTWNCQHFSAHLFDQAGGAFE